MEKLLIAVQSDMFADALSAAFRKDYEIRTCTDGMDALALLNTFQPDALIIYLRLPRLDGFAVVSQAIHTPDLILGITDYNNAFLDRQAELAGISSVVVMPTINAITVRLTQMRLDRQESKKDPQLQTLLMLHNLGLNPKLDGWKMLLVGIPLFLSDTTQTFSKVLYPSIATAVSASDGRTVERCIRDCIAKAWNRREHHIWMKYFPPGKDGTISCPSNSQFIKTLASMIKL